MAVLAKWKISKREPTAESRLIQELQIPEVLAKILVGRGYNTPDAASALLYPQSYYHPTLIPGLVEAAKLTIQVINNRQRILLAGDYDADGICGVAILSHLISSLGVPVSHYIPKRDEGYGFNPAAVDMALQHKAGLIITVDVGISDPETCEYARSLGIPVIITDHHEPQGFIPPAEVVVDLKADQGAYPFRELCGAGIAFKLAQLIASELGLTALPKPCLGLVAIATIADVVPLIDENRILVKAGLQRLNENRPTWISTLLKPGTPIVSQVVGYQIAPVINAAGRMGDPNLALEMLLAHDSDPDAENKALELKELNELRKKLVAEIEAQCSLQVEESEAAGDNVIVIQGDFDAGLVGIIANKIAERLQRPTLVIGENGHGSGRGPDGSNILAIVENVQEFMSDYGGHKQACGFTVSGDVNDLRQKINQCTLPGVEPVGVPIDLVLTSHQITKELVDAIQLLEPFGCGNPAVVVLIKDLHLNGAKLMGSNKEHFKLSLGTLNIVGFHKAPLLKLAEGPIECAVTVNHDDYWGPPHVSAIIQDYDLNASLA